MRVIPMWQVVLSTVAVTLFFAGMVTRADQKTERTACAYVRDATEGQCAIEYENKWYDAGSVTYMREEHIKDLPICRRIGEAAFNACKNPERKDDRPSDE